MISHKSDIFLWMILKLYKYADRAENNRSAYADSPQEILHICYFIKVHLLFPNMLCGLKLLNMFNILLQKKTNSWNKV